MTNDFFDEPLAQSQVKARIVAKYFSSWSQVMLNTPGRTKKDIGFYDLFAGTGSYEDGSKSTPLLILEKAVSNPELTQHLVTIFNDKDENHCARLQAAIESLPGINTLKYKPQISHFEIETEAANFFKSKLLIPSILFLDPWGYKGLSLELIGSVVKDWGCECIFFFNYRRVNAAFDNPLFSDHIDALFGAERAADIRSSLSSTKRTPFERETYILNQLSAALKRQSSQYVLKFRFVCPTIERTSHYLIFATKGFLGYEIMKDIMANESIPDDEPIPTYQYTENPERNQMLQLEDPHEQLAFELHKAFAGQSTDLASIYRQHSPETPYIKKNYRSALCILEERGKLTAQNEGPTKRRVGTFGDKCKITFKK